MQNGLLAHVGLHSNKAVGKGFYEGECRKEKIKQKNLVGDVPSKDT